MAAASSQCQWSLKLFRSNLDQNFYHNNGGPTASFAQILFVYLFIFATTASCAALRVLLSAHAQPDFWSSSKAFALSDSFDFSIMSQISEPGCCKQAPLCRPQVRGHFHVLGASQPTCALVIWPLLQLQMEIMVSWGTSATVQTSGCTSPAGWAERSWCSSLKRKSFHNILPAF